MSDVMMNVHKCITDNNTSKKVNDLTCKFILDNNPNQIERNVCCLNINEGGDGND
jgi:hypothetical protein